MATQSPGYVMQNASHSASLFRQTFSGTYGAAGGILGTGELAITQSATPALTVVMAAGRAVIPGTSVSPPSGFAFTSQGNYFGFQDAPLTLTISTPSATNPRIDAVYLGVTDSFYGGGTNTVVAGVVAGTPAPSPVAPSVPANSLLIATVAVAANATTIVNANITNSASLVTVVNTATSAALTAGLAPVGSKLVVPTSVVVGSGSDAVSALGAITFTGASTVSVNGCFTTTFDNYLVVYDVFSKSAGGTLAVRLRLSGTDASGATDYVAQNTVSTGASVASGGGAASSAQLQSAAAIEDSGTITFFAPALARVTRWVNQESGGISTSSVQTVSGGARHNQAVAYDGFTLIPATGNITGTLRIYGITNG